MPAIYRPFQQIVGGDQSTTPPTLGEESRGVTYAAFKTAIDALRGPSGMFPPLKTAVEGILSIVTIIDVRPWLAHLVRVLTIISKQKYSQNKEDFWDITRKLDAIRLIIERYQMHNSQDILESRLKELSQFVIAYYLWDAVKLIEPPGQSRSCWIGSSGLSSITFSGVWQRVQQMPV